MKVVINKCYGGFSLSRAAVKRMAELQGRPCYFFTTNHLDKDEKYTPAPPETPGKRDLMVFAFDVPNPNEVLSESKPWHKMTMPERRASNAKYNTHSLTNRPDNRADPLLVQVVEELGKAADGACAELAIVEIPDGVDYEIDEYDGMEHIAEKHRTWG